MDKNVRNAVIGVAALAGIYFLFLRKDAKAAEQAAPPAVPPPPPDVGPAPNVPLAKETAGASTPIPAGSTYTIKAGDSLSNLAERAYGNYRWWLFIWDRNRLFFTSPDAIPVGSSIAIPSKAELPTSEQTAYFARAKLHAQAWAGWKGKKGTPPLPDAVLYKDGKPPTAEVTVKNGPPGPLPQDVPPPPMQTPPTSKLVNPPPAAPQVPVRSTEQILEEIEKKGVVRPTGGRAGTDARAQAAWDELNGLWRR
jgi:hypothetical protein